MKYKADKYPRISVIMAALNRESTIEKAILSLVNQQYPNLEFLILDAGSNDGTLNIIKKYNDYINYFRSRKDKGPSDAWNEGVDNCTGDIVCFLNSDDFYEENTLIKVGEAFIENEDADIINVLGRMVSQDNSGELIWWHVTTPEIMHIENGFVGALHPNCRFYKKHLFSKYGKFISEIDGVMTLASDYEFITRLSLYNPKNITLNFIGYNYLGHEGSLTYNNNKYTKLRLYDQKVYYIEELLRNHSEVISTKLEAKFKKEHRVAYSRRVVKNIVDKDYDKAFSNLVKGVNLFGVSFTIKTLRFYISYVFRFNKFFKKIF